MIPVTQIIEVLAASGPRAVAEVLEGIAARKIDPEEAIFNSRAARVLRQQPPGRPPRDDWLLIAQVKNLIEAGSSEHSALTKVGSTRARDVRSLHAIVERLRRKLRKLPTK